MFFNIDSYSYISTRPTPATTHRGYHNTSNPHTADQHSPPAIYHNQDTVPENYVNRPTQLQSPLVEHLGHYHPTTTTYCNQDHPQCTHRNRNTTPGEEAPTRLSKISSYPYQIQASIENSKITFSITIPVIL
jgi:hypothetical protein